MGIVILDTMKSQSEICMIKNKDLFRYNNIDIISKDSYSDLNKVYKKLLREKKIKKRKMPKSDADNIVKDLNKFFHNLNFLYVE